MLFAQFYGWEMVPRNFAICEVEWRQLEAEIPNAIIKPHGCSGGYFSIAMKVEVECEGGENSGSGSEMDMGGGDRLFRDVFQ